VIKHPIKSDKKEPIYYTGVDLGTACVVIAVLDENFEPVAGAYRWASVVRDGMVVDYVGALHLVREMKEELEEKLGVDELIYAAAAIPPGTENVDGGAVAKGQACNVIADALRDHGCINYLVDIGGEVVAKGVNDKGSPWSIGISKPNLNNEGAQAELQEVVSASSICMATSGNYLNYYYVNGERRSHTIDPRTGEPVQHSVLSATVVSSSCMRADAMATACMVLGKEEALRMIERAGDAACYLIVAENDSLSVITSPNWAEMITK
jgi:thiamine biosynthesis lipoprotein ApbE